MTIDHDAIAALVHRADSWDRCYPGNLNVEVLVADLTKAARALNDEVTRLRANLNHVIAERDATFARMLARAEAAEARVAKMVEAYDATNPLRTADMHHADCKCLRCEVDDARQSLKGQTND